MKSNRFKTGMLANLKKSDSRKKQRDGKYFDPSVSLAGLFTADSRRALELFFSGQKADFKKLLAKVFIIESKIPYTLSKNNFLTLLE